MNSNNLNWLALAIPFFLLMIGLEYGVAKAMKKVYFRFNDSVANISVGIAERLLDLFTVGAFYGVYEYLHRYYALLNIQPSVWTWVALFFATDFVWYWYHRLAHEVNLFWAAHVVHHQSEEFNYTVSARITVFQAIIRTGFWAILPVIGFPAGMITTLLLFHGLYPFFIHTRTIGKLGILEYILVTPSHHRVHHASNPQYLDKNYGDVLIIWDKLFGTFAPEVEEPVYGLTKPLRSYSFLWQQFHALLELIEATRRTSGVWAKSQLLFGPPDRIDGQIREQLATRFFIATHPLTLVQSITRLRGYVVGQIIGLLSLLFGLTLFEHQIPVLWQAIMALFILLTLVNCGAILEQRQWVIHLELARLIVLWTFLYIATGDPILIVLAYIGSLCWWVYQSLIQRVYFNFLFGLTKQPIQ
jgi:sterol desaturase/sphingolipid hydroxylase (fatty acid hydroxylase superfamily)